MSPDGRNVYATSFADNAAVVFDRDPSTGALTQLGNGSGCISNSAMTGCTTGRALDGPDTVTVSPDGTSVYSAAFTSNAVGIFTRVTTTLTP